MLRDRFAGLLLGCCALLAACTASGDESSTPATHITQTPASASTRAAPTPDRVLCGQAAGFCRSADGLEHASVVEIIDGDTLDVTVEGREERVRVFGIDTPERGELCFRESSQFLEALAASEVRLLADVRERDRSGRLLRYVYTLDGVSIDALMVRDGMAHAWTRDGALRDPLVALEAQARDARRGCLWDG
jgi:micrococcal nuclease